MPLQDTLQDLFGDSRHRDLLCCIQPLWQLVLVQRGFIWKAMARTFACVEKCLRLMRLAAVLQVEASSGLKVFQHMAKQSLCLELT